MSLFVESGPNARSVDALVGSREVTLLDCDPSSTNSACMTIKSDMSMQLDSLFVTSSGTFQ